MWRESQQANSTEKGNKTESRTTGEDEEINQCRRQEEERAARWRRSRGVLMMKPSRDLQKEHLLFSSYESWDSMRRRQRRRRTEGERERRRRRDALIPAGDPVRVV